MSNSRQFCTFFLDNLLFGVELQKVQEVIRYLDLTAVPLAHRVVSGLMNLRGQIVTAVDLRRRLELEERSQGTLPMNVVVRTSDGAVSMLVDDIGDVVEVEEETFGERRCRTGVNSTLFNYLQRRAPPACGLLRRRAGSQECPAVLSLAR